jgi:translation initiation factor 3 subunit K
LTNLPHIDFVLCKCLLSQEVQVDPQIKTILYLADLLEIFWQQFHNQGELIKSVQGFEDSVRRFVCHVICITYQTIEEVVLGELLGFVQETSVAYWLEQYGWKVTGAGCHVSRAGQAHQLRRRPGQRSWLSPAVSLQALHAVYEQEE